MMERPNKEQVLGIMMAGLFFLVPAMMSQAAPADGLVMFTLIVVLAFSFHAFREAFHDVVPHCNFGYFFRYHASHRDLRTVSAVKRGSSLSRPKALVFCVVLTLFLVIPSVSAEYWFQEWSDDCGDSSNFPDTPWYTKFAASGSAGVTGGECYLTDTSDANYWNVRYNSTGATEAVRINWTFSVDSLDGSFQGYMSVGNETAWVAAVNLNTHNDIIEVRNHSAWLTILDPLTTGDYTCSMLINFTNATYDIDCGGGIAATDLGLYNDVVVSDGKTINQAIVSTSTGNGGVTQTVRYDDISWEIYTKLFELCDGRGYPDSLWTQNDTSAGSVWVENGICYLNDTNGSKIVMDTPYLSTSPQMWYYNWSWGITESPDDNSVLSLLVLDTNLNTLAAVELVEDNGTMLYADAGNYYQIDVGADLNGLQECGMIINQTGDDIITVCCEGQCVSDKALLFGTTANPRYVRMQTSTVNANYINYFDYLIVDRYPIIDLPEFVEDFPDAWSNNETIYIRHSGSTVTDFPYYLEVSKDAAMQDDYDDLRFTPGVCGENDTKLDYYIENYTDSSAHVHVKIPSIASGWNSICMRWGSYYAPSVANEPAIYESTADFRFDYAETSGSAVDDSTSNNNDGVASLDGVGTLDTDGAIGSGVRGDGVDGTGERDGLNISGGSIARDVTITGGGNIYLMWEDGAYASDEVQPRITNQYGRLYYGDGNRMDLSADEDGKFWSLVVFNYDDVTQQKRHDWETRFDEPLVYYNEVDKDQVITRAAELTGETSLTFSSDYSYLRLPRNSTVFEAEINATAGTDLSLDTVSQATVAWGSGYNNYVIPVVNDYAFVIDQSAGNFRKRSIFDLSDPYNCTLDRNGIEDVLGVSEDYLAIDGEVYNFEDCSLYWDTAEDDLIDVSNIYDDYLVQHDGSKYYVRQISTKTDICNFTPGGLGRGFGMWKNETGSILFGGYHGTGLVFTVYDMTCTNVWNISTNNYNPAGNMNRIVSVDEDYQVMSIVSEQSALYNATTGALVSFNYRCDTSDSGRNLMILNSKEKIFLTMESSHQAPNYMCLWNYTDPSAATFIGLNISTPTKSQVYTPIRTSVFLGGGYVIVEDDVYDYQGNLVTTLGESYDGGIQMYKGLLIATDYDNGGELPIKVMNFSGYNASKPNSTSGAIGSVAGSIPDSYDAPIVTHFANSFLDVGDDGDQQWNQTGTYAGPIHVVDFPGETNSTIVAELNSLIGDCDCPGCAIEGAGSAYCNVTFNWTSDGGALVISSSYFGYNATGAGVELLSPANGTTITTESNVTVQFEIGIDDTCSINLNGVEQVAAGAEGGYTLEYVLNHSGEGLYNWSVNCTEQGASETRWFTIDEYDVSSYIKTTEDLYDASEEVKLVGEPDWWNATFTERTYLQTCNDQDDRTHTDEVIGHQMNINVTNLTIYSDPAAELRLIGMDGNEIKSFDAFQYGLGEGDAWALVSYIVYGDVPDGDCYAAALYYNNDTPVAVTDWGGDFIESFDDFDDNNLTNDDGLRIVWNETNPNVYNYGGFHAANGVAVMETGASGYGVCVSTGRHSVGYNYMLVSDMHNYSSGTNGPGMYVTAGYKRALVPSGVGTAYYYDIAGGSGGSSDRVTEDWNTMTMQRHRNYFSGGYIQGDFVANRSTYIHFGSSNAECLFRHSAESRQNIWIDNYVLYYIQDTRSYEEKAYSYGNQSVFSQHEVYPYVSSVTSIQDDTDEVYVKLYVANYTKRCREVTINSASDVDNFTAYVEVAKHDSMNANFSDIQFFDGACGSTTPLCHVIENYTDSIAYFWTGLINVTAPSKVISYTYGDGSENIENASCAWNENDAQLNLLDGYYIDASNFIAPAQVGNGLEEAVSTPVVEFGHDGALGVATYHPTGASERQNAMFFSSNTIKPQYEDYTYELLIKANGTGHASSEILTVGDSFGDAPFRSDIWSGGGNLWTFYVYNSSGDSQSIRDYTSDIHADGWNYLVATVDVDGNVTLYVDGVKTNSTSLTNYDYAYNSTINYYMMGINNGNKYEFKGWTDFFRVSIGVARSEAYISLMNDMIQDYSNTIVTGADEYVQDQIVNVTYEDWGTCHSFNSTDLLNVATLWDNLTMTAGEYLAVMDVYSCEVNDSLLSDSYPFSVTFITLDSPADEYIETTTNDINLYFTVGLDDTCTVNVNGQPNATAGVTAGVQSFLSLSNLEEGDYNWSVNCTNAGWSETRSFTINEYDLSLNIQTYYDLYVPGQDIGITDPPEWENDGYRYRQVIEIDNPDGKDWIDPLIGHPHGINVSIVCKGDCSKNMMLYDNESREVQTLEIWDTDDSTWARIKFVVNGTILAGESVNYTLYSSADGAGYELPYVSVGNLTVALEDFNDNNLTDAQPCNWTGGGMDTFTASGGKLVTPAHRDPIRTDGDNQQPLCDWSDGTVNRTAVFDVIGEWQCESGAEGPLSYGRVDDDRVWAWTGRTTHMNLHTPGGDTSMEIVGAGYIGEVWYRVNHIKHNDTHADIVYDNSTFYNKTLFHNQTSLEIRDYNHFYANKYQSTGTACQWDNFALYEGLINVYYLDADLTFGDQEESTLLSEQSRVDSNQSDTDQFVLYMYIKNESDSIVAETYVDWGTSISISDITSPIKLDQYWVNYTAPGDWLGHTMTAWVELRDEANRTIYDDNYSFNVSGEFILHWPVNDTLNTTDNNISFVVESPTDQDCDLHLIGDNFEYRFRYTLSTGNNTIYAHVLDDTYNWTMDNCSLINAPDQNGNLTVDEYDFTFNIKTLKDDYIGGETLGITDPPQGWPALYSWSDDMVNFSSRVMLETCNYNDSIIHIGELIGYPYGINVTGIVINENASKELRLTDSSGNEMKNFDVWNYGSDWATVTYFVNESVGPGNCTSHWLYYNNNVDVEAPSYDGLVQHDQEHAKYSWEDCRGAGGAADLFDGDPANWSGQSVDSFETDGSGHCRFTGNDGRTTRYENHYVAKPLLMVASLQNYTYSTPNSNGIGLFVHYSYQHTINLVNSTQAKVYWVAGSCTNSSLDGYIKPETEWNVLTLSSQRNIWHGGYVNGYYVCNTSGWPSSQTSPELFFQSSSTPKHNVNALYDDMITYIIQEYPSLEMSREFKAYGIGNMSTVTQGTPQNLPSWSYTHQAWAKRTNITVVNDNDFDHNNYVGRVNVTNLTLSNNCTNELRAVKNGNWENITIQTIKDGSSEAQGDQWCEVIYYLDLEANTNFTISFYHDFAAAPMPDYPTNMSHTVHNADLIEIHTGLYDDLHFLLDGGSITTTEGGSSKKYYWNGQDVGAANYLGIGVQGRNETQEWAYEMPFSGSDVDQAGPNVFVNATCSYQIGPIAAYINCTDYVYNFTNEWIITNHTQQMKVWGGENDHYYRLYHQHQDGWSIRNQDFAGVNQSYGGGASYEEHGSKWWSGENGAHCIVTANNYYENKTPPYIRHNDWNTWWGSGDASGNGAAYHMNSTEPYEYTFYHKASLGSAEEFRLPMELQEVYFENPIVYSQSQTEGETPLADQSRIDNTQADLDDYTLRMIVTDANDFSNEHHVAYENWSLRSISAGTSPVKLDELWENYTIDLPSGTYTAWIVLYNDLNISWGSLWNDSYNFTVSNEVHLISPNGTITDTQNITAVYSSTTSQNCTIWRNGAEFVNQTASIGNNTYEFGVMAEDTTHNWTVTCEYVNATEGEVEYTINEYELTGSIQTLEQFYDVNDTVGITDPPEGGEGGDGLIHSDNSVTWLMTNTELPQYGPVNSTCFRDNDGMKYCFDLEKGYFNIFDYQDDFRRKMGFAITADQGERSTDQFTWELTDHGGSKYELSNYTNILDWQMFFDFDPADPMKITHNITNNFGTTLTDAKMWYLFTINPGETAEYNGVNYSLDNDYNLTENLNERVPKIQFPESVFNFSDVIDDGYNITNLYVGDAGFIGFPSLRILAVGLSSQTGNWPDGVTATIDPIIIGLGDFNETILEITITPETSTGLNYDEIDVIITNDLNQSIEFFRAELTDDPNMDFKGFYHEGAPISGPIEILPDENTTISYHIEWVPGTDGKFNVSLGLRLENGTIIDALIDPFWSSTWRLGKEVTVDNDCNETKTDVLMNNVFFDDIFIYDDAAAELRLVNMSCDSLGGIEWNFTINQTDDKYRAWISWVIPTLENDSSQEWCLYYANESVVSDPGYIIPAGIDSGCVDVTVDPIHTTQQSRVDSLQSDDDCIYMRMWIEHNVNSTEVYEGYSNMSGMWLNSTTSPIKLDQYWVNWTDQPYADGGFDINLELFSCWDNSSILLTDYTYVVSSVLRLYTPFDDAINTTTNEPEFIVEASDIFNNCSLYIDDVENVSDFTLDPGYNIITGAGKFSEGEYNWTVNCTTGASASQTFNLTIDEYDMTIFAEANQSTYKPTQVQTLTLSSNITNNQGDNDFVYLYMYVRNESGSLVHVANEDWDLQQEVDGIYGLEPMYQTYTLPQGNQNYTIFIELYDNMNVSLYDYNTTFEVYNTLPIVENCTMTPTPAYFNDTVSCVCNYSDADGDPIVTTYVDWRIDHITNESNTNLSWSGVHNATDLVGCSVTPWDGFSNGTVARANMYIYNYAPIQLTYENISINEDELLEYDFNCTDSEGHAVNHTIWQTSWSAPTFP